MGIKSISIGGRSDIKKVTLGGGVLFEKASDYPGLCFTAEQAGSTVAMSVKGTPTQGQAFEYSTDGRTWQEFVPGSTTVTLDNVGDKMWMRGDNTTVSESASIRYKFVMTGVISASGNIMSLLDKTCRLVIINNTACFYALFAGCTSLTTPPELPATTLSSSCYSETFFNCTSLTTPPALPATTLAIGCCLRMFSGCTSLVSVPSLPATTLNISCYGQMFQNCNSLYASDATGAEHSNAWSIPANGEATGDFTMTSMFGSCRGTRSTDSPNFNGIQKTYYTQNTPVS